MGAMILAGREDNLVLLILLVALLGLTFAESRELGLDKRLTIWWLLFVALTHALGYLALRLWGPWWKKQRA
ncbi:MAG: hypothetical protein ACR2P0_17975 [Acidimicrobiales bacterium]